MSEIRGRTQIKDGTVNAAKLEASFNLPTAQLAEGASFIKKDGTVAFTADQPMGGFKLTGLGTPVAANDAVNKSYADSLVAGLDTLPSVKAMSTTNVALSGPATLDGISCSASDRVLLVGQTSGAQNGPWIVNVGAWTRPIDYPAGSSTKVTSAAFLFVEQGTTYGDTGWTISTDISPITVDTTATAWTQFNAGAQTVGGAGLLKTGNTLDVGAGNGISVAADSIAVLPDPAGNLAVSAAGIRIAPGTAGQILITNTAGTQVGSVTISGDATITPAGAVTVVGFVKTSKLQLTPVTLTGAVDGTNKTFTIPVSIVAGTESVMINGLTLEPTKDYTISASTVTLTATTPAPSNVGQVDWVAAQYVAA